MLCQTLIFLLDTDIIVEIIKIISLYLDMKHKLLQCLIFYSFLCRLHFQAFNISVAIHSFSFVHSDTTIHLPDNIRSIFSCLNTDGQYVIDKT